MIQEIKKFRVICDCDTCCVTPPNYPKVIEGTSLSHALLLYNIPSYDFNGITYVFDSEECMAMHKMKLFTKR